MNDLNSVLIEGNVVRDPEIKDFGEGKKLQTFSIASNRYKKGGEKKTGFFEIKYWSDKVKPLKGDFVRVTGNLDQESWEKDGKKNYKVLIAAEWVGVRGKDKGIHYDPQVPQDSSEEKIVPVEKYKDDIPF